MSNIKMLYIIDANNVAGKLKMLGQDDFDKKLLQLFIDFNQDRNKEIELVFDGSDRMGDRQIIDNKLTVIYSPKDDFYTSADDKIVEMVERLVNREKKSITVVTDDIGLQKRVEEIGGRYNANINMERATFWAGKLTEKSAVAKGSGVAKEELGQEEITNINEELMKRWC